ncbi:hypothetical protein RMN57_34165 [Kitasatospora sp. CM 4170]|uniref:DUF11 domain-containing protein n=1 Tax=Kitasatospora aburaviensis TaxID=67265 RepID=A0ABW1F9V8_9ACTN|nr:hypothetical protein [Kitasatospora sp. CM 4170]WNM49380.1 hypothetical protein RMN57_34165 [Kitasatospora sp. CM 4170]
MRTSLMSRFGLAAILALVLGLLLSAAPAQADTPLLAVSSDKATATPGSSVTLTLTLTNPHDTPVQFVYQSVQPTYGTSQATGLKYAFSACGGNVGGCDTGATNGLVHHTVPVAAGATTTVTLTYDIAADSACGSGARIDFYTYLYYEYQSGAAADSGIFDVPGNEVTCAA